MHYVPQWIKTDPKRFSRMINASGEPIDVLSAKLPCQSDADKKAFAALMRHLKSVDGDEHTILLVQVENESGGIGTVRDFSPDANAAFAGQVPATCWQLFTSRPALGARFSVPRPTKLFKPIIKRITSTRLRLRVRLSSPFRCTSMYGSAIRPRSCPSVAFQFRGFNIPAAVLCRNL